MTARTGVGSAIDAFACAYVTDRAYLPITCFSIASLFESRSRDFPVHLFLTGVEPSEVAVAERYFGRVGYDVRLAALPVGDFSHVRSESGLPGASYGRLMLPQILATSARRIVYLDGDTLIDRDIHELATLDLHGNTIGAVPDLAFLTLHDRQEVRARLGLPADAAYFNSGVLLIDVARWREQKVLDRALAASHRQPALFKEGDQCLLNHVLARDWLEIDPSWNWQPLARRSEPWMTRAIHHFAGGKKPWNTERLRFSSRWLRRYRDYFAASPWTAEYKPPALPDAAIDAYLAVRRVFAPRTYAERARYRALVKSRS